MSKFPYSCWICGEDYYNREGSDDKNWTKECVIRTVVCGIILSATYNGHGGFTLRYDNPFPTVWAGMSFEDYKHSTGGKNVIRCTAACESCYYGDDEEEGEEEDEEENILTVVEHDGLAIQDAPIQTELICLTAVQENGLALEFVREQTYVICLSAVQQNGLALEFVRDQLKSPEICLAAVRQNGLALEFVRDQTREICLAAVRQNGLALEFVRDQTPAICLAAVKNGRKVIDLVRTDLQTPALYMTAIYTDVMGATKIDT